MSTTVTRWLHSALPFLVLAVAVGIIGMHAVAGGHGAHGASPVAAVHAPGAHDADRQSPGSAVIAAHERPAASAEDHVPRSRPDDVGAVPHPHGNTDCVPALLGTGAPVSAPTTPVAAVVPPMYRVGAELTARAIAPPRPCLIILSISRT